MKRLQSACNKLGYSKQTVDGIKGPNTLKACPTLKLGANNEIVKLLQEQLNKQGYNAGTADGKFGQNTRAAVCRFQKGNVLVADGIFGKESWSKLLDRV